METNELYRWVLGGMLAHMVLAYLICFLRFGNIEGPPRSGPDDFMRIATMRGFNSATFAGSVTLLVGVFDQDILRAIGDTTPFLIAAGLIGSAYGVHVLFKG